MGRHELVMYEEVRWEEVVVVMCLKRGKAAGPDKIENEMLVCWWTVDECDVAGDEYTNEASAVR